eukprot:gene7097-9683_t
MWGNIAGAVGSGLQTLQKLQTELESQLDAAVGADDKQKQTSIPSINPIDVSVSKAGDLKKDSPIKIKEDDELVSNESNDFFDNFDKSIPIKTSNKIVDIKSSSANDNLLKAVEIQKESLGSDRKLDETEQKVVTNPTKKNAKKNNTKKESKAQTIINEPITVHENEMVDVDLNNSSKIGFDSKKYDEMIATVENKYTNKINELNQQIIEKDKNFELYKNKTNLELQSLQDTLLNEKNHNNVQQKRKEEEFSNEIIKLKNSYETKIKELLLAKENSGNADATSINYDNSNKLNLHIQELEKIISGNDETNKILNEKYQIIIEENSQLKQDILKMKEIVNDRERALETASKNLSETLKLYHDSQQKISDLNVEIVEKDARNRQHQTNTAEEVEMKKQLLKLQELNKEKDERLASFAIEGQNLAKKQGEMEKLLKKSKNEIKEKELEIAKLKESKEQLLKAIEELQELLRKHENETNNASKSLSAMQAVSQASSEKLSRLEAEINSKSDELASQRRALENSWNEINELKRSNAELRADRDDLKRQIGEGTSKVMETESSRRDIEQREAVLRATNKQMQDTLQQKMQESNIREERLREEVNEMRKRWQEAISSREAMASEL